VEAQAAVGVRGVAVVVGAALVVEVVFLEVAGVLGAEGVAEGGERQN
jgi:hypothetical protein